MLAGFIRGYTESMIVTNARYSERLVSVRPVNKITNATIWKSDLCETHREESCC